MSASHAVQINGLCASALMSRSRAFAAAADAAAARPDATVCVVRYRRGSVNPETVAVVSQPKPIAQSAPTLPGESAAPMLPSHGTAAPTLPRFTVETYRGCRDGWTPTVTRTDRAAADRLMTLIGRIRPQCIHRISVV